jgi:hypothetical protein
MSKTFTSIKYDGNDAEYVSFLGRHLVCLGCDHFISSTGDDERGFVASGFLIAIEDNWFLATSGHVLTDIDSELLKHPERRYIFKLIDFIGTSAVHRHPVPFEYKDQKRYSKYDEDSGIDFGLIAISPFYRKQLEANSLVPVTEDKWKDQDIDRFEHFYMLGLPQERSRFIERGKTIVQPAMLKVMKLTVPPKQLERHTQPMLYAEMTPTPGLDSIVGMSGCPIIGFMSDASEHHRYGVVAIQSGWLRNSRITYACRIEELVAVAYSAVGPRGTT